MEIYFVFSLFHKIIFRDNLEVRNLATKNRQLDFSMFIAKKLKRGMHSPSETSKIHEHLMY